MPKKTLEEVREKVVQLRKGGATYTQIERNPETINPDTGKPLARPTLIKILREAGLTKRANAEAQTTPPPSSAGMPSKTPSLPVPASSNGVDDFMPKAPKKAPSSVEFQCDQCGTEFIGTEDDPLPEVCPECGG